MREPTKAQIDVLAERERQIEVEGWTPAHDSRYQNNELVTAAISYAMPNQVGKPLTWPFSDLDWKPTDVRRNLVKATALLLAEIERIDNTTK